MIFNIQQNISDFSSLWLTGMPLPCEDLSLFCHYGMQDIAFDFQVLLGKVDQQFLL